MEQIQTIMTEELERKLAVKEPVNLVDVREDDEVRSGMIPGAKHIPMGEIPANLDYFDKEKEYIFICQAGYRSGNVCSFLQDKGYKVINLVGGMQQWAGEVITK